MSLRHNRQLTLPLRLDEQQAPSRHQEWGGMLVDLLAQFGYVEFDRLSENLHRVLYQHYRQVGKFNKALITGLPIEGSDLKDEDSHRRCTFGNWYYSQKAVELIQNAEFIAFGKLHENFHVCMRDLILEVEGGSPIRPEDYEYFLESYHLFTDKLTEIINQTSFVQFQFDHLTNLLNRRAFMKILEYEHHRLQRYHRPCCLAMADIDHFKKINDSFGHKSGDTVLKNIAIASQEIMRSNDSVGRYGGEEFIFCLPDTKLATAKTVMNRLRKKVEALRIPLDNGNVAHVTLSFGIAELRKTRSIDMTIERADKALYLAKKRGRNRVVAWEKSLTSTE